MDLEKKHLDKILIYVGAITISLLFFTLYEHIQKDTYYFIYPKYSAVTTYIFLIIGIVLTIVLARKYLSYRKVKKFTTKFTIYSIALILSSSITIGCVKYLVYTVDKTSYLIDEHVLSKQLENEKKQFKTLIGQLEAHMFICNSLVGELEHKKNIIGTRQYVDLFFGIIKNRETDFYQSKIKDIKLLLKRVIPNPEPELDPLEVGYSEEQDSYEPNDHSYKYSIEISSGVMIIEIEETIENCPYFINLYKKPNQLSSQILTKIILSHIEVLDSHINQLTENISLIEKRGLPLSYFTMDSMMKSFNSSPGYYKPINLWTMLLSLLHILIIVYFIIPLIGIGSELLKLKFNKIDR